MRSTVLARFTLLLFVAWASLAIPNAGADVIPARSAELRLEEDHYVLDADFDLTLNSTLEEAIGRGVPLYFVVEFDLWRPRLLWFDELVASQTINYRLSYNALTRQYRLSSGGAFFQNLATLEEAQRLISRIRGRTVVD